jgi:hypothetical protein
MMRDPPRQSWQRRAYALADEGAGEKDHVLIDGL